MHALAQTPATHPGGVPPTRRPVRRGPRVVTVAAAARPARDADCGGGRGDPPPPPHTVVSRRDLLAAVAAATAAVACPPLPATAAEEGDASTAGGLVFTSPAKGYTLSPPPTWAASSKAGADAFWSAPGIRGATLGVVVLPVRLADLAGAGSLAEVGRRLVDAEEAKDGTLGVALTASAAVGGREGGGGGGSDGQPSSSAAPSYRYEYVLATTRVFKTVVTAVAVARGNLFIVTGMAPCEGGAKVAAGAVEAGLGGEGVCSAPVLGAVRAAVDSFAVQV